MPGSTNIKCVHQRLDGIQRFANINISQGSVATHLT